MNVLVVKPSSLGDIVHTFPAVQLIRRSYPDAHISCVTSAVYTDLVHLCPAVDDVVLFRRQRLGQVRNWGEIPSFVRDLRVHRYDVAIDFQGLLRSSLIACASRAARRVGFRRAREGAQMLYTEKVLLPANLKHAVERNLFLARSALNISDPAPEPVLQKHHDSAKRAGVLLRKHGLQNGRPLVAVAPGARWTSKRWPPEFYARVLDRAADINPAVWVLGTTAERRAAEELRQACSRCEPVDLTGETDIGTMTELLRVSDVLLANDSGPMHIAAALGTRWSLCSDPATRNVPAPTETDTPFSAGSARTRPVSARNVPGKRSSVRPTSMPRRWLMP